ncbi:hypothetical protein H5410_060768 [Solanum commersonii]|uniref:Uncharacterized protein n=1 Tax=Solanum commersonii TaxID=4109 RepID=A0A9J5W658_SOLCO|nr:hypothetical protein H5410_060768 [Solanum commersonii]
MTTTSTFTGIATVLTTCVATTTTASATITVKWPDSPETTTFSTNSLPPYLQSPPYPRLPYTIEAAFTTAAEEVDEEEVVFSVASLTTFLGCDLE